MKQIYLLCLAVILAACSAEPVENEILTGLDANLQGKGNNVTIQNLGEAFNSPDQICVGMESEFCLTFPQKYKGNGELQTTQIQVQIEVAPGEWVPIHQNNANTTSCFTYSFLDDISYNLRYQIGGGGFTGVIVSVEDCEAECPAGYMIGDKNFALIGTSKNWGWAHEFNFEGSGSETREIHHKNGSLGGDVTIAYANGIVTVTEGTGVTITHLYISNEEPTTNAPGQFDKTQQIKDADGSFWVIIKAEVCE